MWGTTPGVGLCEYFRCAYFRDTYHTRCTTLLSRPEHSRQLLSLVLLFSTLIGRNAFGKHKSPQKHFFTPFFIDGAFLAFK